jgi:hypothetical protein
MVRGEKSNSEKMRRLAGFKEVLERKIADAESEIESLRTLLEFVNKTLLEKGFKRAEIAKPSLAEESVLPPAIEYETVVPFKAVTGELLANLYLSQDCMRVTIAQDKTFSVNTPPFQQFLTERVLSKMQEKDREAASRGEITLEKVFSYELILDGESLREIAIENLTPDRMRELRSTIHWTLEKMYEKMQKDL